jgi:hypothetical protein
MRPQVGGGARLGLGGYKSDSPMDWENNMTGAGFHQGLAAGSHRSVEIRVDVSERFR